MPSGIEQLRQSWSSAAGLAAGVAARPLPAETALQRLSAVILLGGAVRRPILSVKTSRSILDLPVSDDQNFLSYWQSQALSLLEWLSGSRLPLRVLLAHDSIEPRQPMRLPSIPIHIERDPMEYRGIGGVLRDLAGDYQDDDYVLVLSASQLLLRSLPELVMMLANADQHEAPDVSLISHHDGTPNGMSLIRCGALKCVPEVGFVDFKEQALGVIAQHHRVQVVHPALLSAIPMRTHMDYLSALRWRHHERTVSAVASQRLNPFEEDWRPAFRIVENGADVASSAAVHDSVILRGAQVQRGATVVRSVLGPGAVVRAGVVCLEQLIGHDG